MWSISVIGNWVPCLANRLAEPVIPLADICNFLRELNGSMSCKHQTFRVSWLYVRIRIYIHSLTPPIACDNFLRKWRDLQFNTPSERQIFKKLFHARFIYSQSFCQQSAERKSSKKYFFFTFRFDAWPGIRTWTLRLMRLPNRLPQFPNISTVNCYTYIVIGHYNILVRITILLLISSRLRMLILSMNGRNAYSEQQIYKKLTVLFNLRNFARWLLCRPSFFKFVWLISKLGFEPRLENLSNKKIKIKRIRLDYDGSILIDLLDLISLMIGSRIQSQ